MTTWNIKLTKKAFKSLSSLTQQNQQYIQRYINEKILKSGHPKMLGKPLTGNLKSFWRNRVGNYRIICQHTETTLTILIIEILHRKEAYKK